MTQKAFIDAGTDTLYIELPDRTFLVVDSNGETGIAQHLPGVAAPLVNEDEVDTSDAYQEGYDDGYSAGENDSYTDYDLEAEYERGFEDGRAEGYEDGYADGVKDDDSE